MQRKRKLWATQFWGVHTPRSAKRRHESKAAAYRYVEAQVANWLDGAVLSKTLTVYVDERDGQGWQTFERIDLDELAKAARADGMTPKRIQRKRVKGWRMPEGAVYVGRPTEWGNPFAVTHCDAVHVSSRHWHVYAVDDGALWLSTHEAKRAAIEDAVSRFRMVMQVGDRKRDMVRSELAGKDLACWCPLDEPCHADVLLEIANGGAS